MSFFGTLMGLFAVIFWITRILVAFTASMDIDFMLKPLNLPTEIILTFVTLFCIIFIFRKSIIGAIVYLLSYWGYFGVFIYKILTSTEEVVTSDYLNILVSTLGILLPLIVLIDIGFSQSSKRTTTKTKKTDWFFQNEEFDREYDERADKNQYKF